MASENDNRRPKIVSASEVLVSPESVLVSIAALVFPFLGVTLSSPSQFSAFPGIWAALSSPDLWHSVWLGRFFWASGIEIVLAVGVGLLFSKVTSSASLVLVLLLFVVSAISLLCSQAIPGIRGLEEVSVLRDLSISLPIYAAAILASLRLVPRSVYDAALVDGASTWLTFSRIMWPVLAPAMIVVVLSRLFVLLQEFARHYSLPATIPLACVLVILAGVFVWRALAAGLLLTFRERTPETKPIDTVKLLEESNANLVEAKVRSKEGVQIQIFGEAAWVTLPPEFAQRLQEHPTEKITISFRPTNVHILSEPKKTAFHGVVHSFEPLGKMGLLTIEAVDGTHLRALVDGSLSFAIDRRVSFWVDPDDLVLQNWQLDPSAGQSEKTV